MAREYGYMIDVRLFVPVNPKSIENTLATSRALDAIVNRGDFSGIDGDEVAATVLKSKHRYTSREVVTEVPFTPGDEEVMAHFTGGEGIAAQPEPDFPEVGGPAIDEDMPALAGATAGTPLARLAQRRRATAE